MRLALVLNPHSGGIDDAPGLVDALRARCDALTVHEPGAHDLALAQRPDRLVVAGGDGSIAPCFAAAAAADVPLAVIPAGTANDFARALELPLDLREALQLAAEPNAPSAAAWGGTIAGRPFVNVASAGLAVEAMERAEGLKRAIGPAAYPAGAAMAGLRGRPTRAALDVEGKRVVEGRAWQLMIGASGRFGGGAGLGEADLSDPQLIAAWVPAGSRLTLPLRAFGLLGRTLERQSGVQWWSAHRMSARASRRGRPAHWNVDGERWRPPSVDCALAPLGPAQVIVAR